MNRDRAVGVVGAAWLLALGAGLWAWERHDATPGTAGAGAAAVEPAGGWRLTVFVHPRCPCSRAGMPALAELARTPGLAVAVRFVRPPGVADGWEHGPSWDAAAAIPGADVSADPGGEAARRTGAETSGHAVLADPAGRVVFRGGLAPARGRAGDGPGVRAVRHWATGRPAAADAPVFGCPLFDPER